jgi:hypothetical protein
MKKLVMLALLLGLVAISGSAFSSPPEKSAILHCGCNELGTGLEYNELSVSSKSRGHDQHVPGNGVESCFDGVDAYTDFVRTASDCQLSGPALGDPIAACSVAVEGDSCGAEVTD